ncbi:hypothetical protein CFN78_23395 [Amycolatopsis antarctica]|uniref:DUF1015 domain-containing protein n=1 Tax=Amycolatopsis antarctica TaxID=1854586 RepID=A0A263CZM9_9PSEU|nr:DUF1015 family protein [Amycolatopsis antarctica]OZM70857.1 hypothetical protein CFN78_23395 [Amycolatopsis antarctica]
MTGWVRPIEDGWVVRGDVPGPDVDEFAEPERVTAALARPGAAARTLLAVQHPHRTPAARAAGLDLTAALPGARDVLALLRRTAYRPVSRVLAPYQVDGPDGAAIGVLAMVDPAAVDAEGVRHVRHGEQVYPEVVAERAQVLSGLGCATSAAMLVPVSDAAALTTRLRRVIADAGSAAVSTVDSSGRRHRVWLLGPGPEQDIVLAAASAHPLMVADGNHRVAAAAAAGLDGLLALVTAGPGLRVGAFHRELTGTGLGADELRSAWRRLGVDVREAGPAGARPPGAPGSVVVRCGDRTLLLRLPPPDGGESVPRIDHAVVENLLLDKALGIDPEGPLVRPLPAGREPGEAADAVIMIAPVPLGDVRAVHAAGMRMPRKSTYFTPKPRSGLVLAELG